MSREQILALLGIEVRKLSHRSLHNYEDKEFLRNLAEILRNIDSETLAAVVCHATQYDHTFMAELAKKKQDDYTL